MDSNVDSWSNFPDPNAGMKSELMLSAISIVIVVAIVLILKKKIKKRAEKQGKEEKHPFRVILKWYYIIVAIVAPFYIWLSGESYNDLWAGAFLIGVPIGMCLAIIGGGWLDTLKSIFGASIVAALILHFGKVIEPFRNNFEVIVKSISSIAFVISAIKMFGSKGDFLRKQEKRQVSNYVGSYGDWSSPFESSSGDVERKENWITGDYEYVDKNTGKVVATGKKDFFDGSETITDVNGNTYKENKGIFSSSYTDSHGNVAFKKEEGAFGNSVIKDSNGNTIYEGDDDFLSDGINYKKK